MSEDEATAPNHLYKWQLEVETHGKAAFPSKGAGPTVRMSSHDCGGRMRVSVRSATFEKSRGVLCTGVGMSYAFIRAHRDAFDQPDVGLSLPW